MNSLILRSWGLFLIIALGRNVQAQTITNQPQSVTVNNASSAMFSVGASGAVSYQWRLNGTPLSDTGNISGSTNATLSLENVTSNQAGNYSVVINGTVASTNAVLSIIPGTMVTFSFSGLMTNAPGSNLTVQLFDHDKPATVQNFLHYIKAGAFTNMFMERCIPGFVLQGGDFGASNRTDAVPPVSGWDIFSEFVLAPGQSPPFPEQIGNEYNTGPQIKNDFGTLVLPLKASFGGFGPALPNSGANGFFFNLADNSGAPYFLDNVNNGPFTVFGRVISGSNVLQYFNGLTTNSGISTNSQINDDGTFQTLADLPVNYVGTNAAANSNLVYCDLTTEPTNLSLDTTPPTVVITSPVTNAFLTNGPVIQGTASDVGGIANVIATLTPQVTDGFTANGGVAMSNIAYGANWSIPFSSSPRDTTDPYVAPGSYALSVQAQDGAGNLSTPATQNLVITGVAIDGPGTVAFTNAGLTTLNPVGFPLTRGSNYGFSATAGPGQAFVEWTYGNSVTNSPKVEITYNGGLLTAHFIATTTPGGKKGVTVSYPPPNGRVTTNSFLLKGRIAATAKSAEVVCQISSSNSTLIVFSASTTTALPTWEIPVTNLAPGDYLLEVTATNASGFGGYVFENFSIVEFKGVAGIYSGLFLPESGSVAGTNSGLFTFSLSSAGTFSGKIQFPAYRAIQVAGKFADNGTFPGFQVNYPGNPFVVLLSLNVTNSGDMITGNVYGTSLSWISSLTCYRAAAKLSPETMPATGKYILDLVEGSVTNPPVTNGYAAVTIGSPGNVLVTGALPDGAAFSQASHIGTNGVWPLYAEPTGDKTNGFVMGWETNLPSNGGVTGQLFWVKKQGVGTYYAAGVNTNLNSVGTNYTTPAAGNYAIVFSGGSIASSVTNNLTVARAGGQFKVEGANNKLALSTSAAGVITGHFANPVDGELLQFKGAFFGQEQGGSGFILEENNQTGSFVLKPE